MKVLILILFSLVIGGVIGFFVGFQLASKPLISSFEQCVAAGYPVMESYPEQCKTPDGRNFVR